MVKTRKYIVKKTFEGIPKRDDYEIVEEELPPIKEGEILVKTEWISVDPYLRVYNLRHTPPFVQFSYQVGVVVESKIPDYPVGTRVVSHRGWQTYIILSTKINDPFMDGFYKLPDLKGLPASLGVGIVGMPGATAYFGLLDICHPKAGETVVVTGAAGAIGNLVGQIAKIKGCYVIGFAGTDEKVKLLETEHGFDKAFNYKTVDIAKTLKEAAPNGIDVYFDNVGGEIASTIIQQMNMFGRVSACGSMSSYNEDQSKLPKATVLQPAVVFKQLKIEGYLAGRWRTQWPEAFADIVQWIHEGKIKYKEHVTEGFDNIVEAFQGIFKGDNTGKAVIKV